MNIYVPVNASPVEQNAANELSTYLQKAYGEEFAIVAECGCEKGIYVGFTNFAAQRNIRAQGGINELNGAEAWLICAVDDSLVITGGNCSTDRGIIYAAEHFLEDVVGIRFWNSIEEYVPALHNFEIEPTLCLSGEPKMIMRLSTVGTVLGNDALYAVRHRCNFNEIPKSWGGGVKHSRSGHCHTLDRIFPREGVFEQHPDWFAWNDGMQKHLPYGQYCMNNQGFIQAFEKAFLDDIAMRYAECDAEGISYPHHFHISLDDTDFECQCPLCKQSIAKSGSTGNFLRFVNRIAKAAREKHPHILVEVLAYKTYIEPPLDDTLPESNVPVRLANLDIDILHDLQHPNNAHGLFLLKTWADICKRAGVALHIWDYNVDYTGICTPNVRRLSSLFSTYDEYGVQAHYMEHELALLTDMWCLKEWLLVHLLEDAYADTEALTADFMSKYYGPAAPFLTQWMNMQEDETASSALNMCCVRNFIKAGHIPYKNYIEGNRLFDLAEESVRGNDIFTLRVRQARASLDLSICLRYDSLHYLARRKGEVFPIPREIAGTRYALTVHQTVQQLRQHQIGSAKNKIELWEGVLPMAQWQTPYKEPALPLLFEGTGALQLNLADYIQLGSKGCGYVHVRDDESLSGMAAFLKLEGTPQIVQDLATVRSRADSKKPAAMSLEHNGQMIYRNVYLEELTKDQYDLYHIMDIDDITEGSNSILRVIHSLCELHLSGLAKELFPNTRLSLWIRAKYSGKFYGGSSDNPDGIFFDRMYIVPIAKKA